MLISPRTQALMQVPTAQDTQEAFEQGFSDTATRVFMSKFPDLASLVSTFKIVSSDSDKGNAVGAFLLSGNDATVIIPIIMAANNVKPLEILYHQETDTYAPLNKQWVDEVMKKGADTLGHSVKMPKTLSRDVDIRNLVIPPYVGRYSYAAARTATKLGAGNALADVLTKAPNRIKRAFSALLQKNKRVLKYAFETFDQALLLKALEPHPEKTAAGPDVEWLTVNDSPERFREVFGTDAGLAFSVAAKLGYVAQDVRTKTAMLVEDGVLRFSEVYESGFYRFKKTDGSSVQALVICNPISLRKSGVADLTLGPSKAPKQRSNGAIAKTDERGPSRNQSFLIYTENGNVIRFERSEWAPVAMPLHREDIHGKLRDVLNGKGDALAPNSHGIFVQIRPHGISGTDVIDIVSATTDSKNVRRIKARFDYEPVTLVTAADSSIQKIVARPDENLMYVPRNMVFIVSKPFDYTERNNLVTTATANILLNEGLKKTGAVELTLRTIGAGEFVLKRAEWREGQNVAHRIRLGNEEAAVRQFVDAGLRFNDAVSAVKTAAVKGTATFFAVTREQTMKLAQEPGVDPAMMAPEGQAPPEAMDGVDPATGMPIDPATGMPMGGAPPEMPIDPATGMPVGMAPPPPSPVDLAVADVSAAYAQQAADVAQQLASQQQALADRLSVLQEVKQRADEISMNRQTGEEIQPVAVTPAEDMVPPPPDEEMMSGGPEEEGYGEMPLEEGLPVDMGGSLETAAGAAEPLQNPELFEATALANLAANPDLKAMSADYIPAMEDTLDHLARMLLTLWLNESEYSEAMGNSDYSALEEKLRSVFGNLGELILHISRGVPNTNAAGTEP